MHVIPGVSEAVRRAGHVLLAVAWAIVIHSLAQRFHHVFDRGRQGDVLPAQAPNAITVAEISRPCDRPILRRPPRLGLLRGRHSQGGLLLRGRGGCAIVSLGQSFGNNGTVGTTSIALLQLLHAAQ